MPRTRPTSPMAIPMINVLTVDALTIPPRPGTAIIVEAPEAPGSFGRRFGRLREPEGHGDTRLQLGGHFLAAFRNDDPAEVELEREALRARRAVAEVPGDRAPFPDGEFPVEVLV